MAGINTALISYVMATIDGTAFECLGVPKVTVETAVAMARAGMDKTATAVRGALNPNAANITFDLLVSPSSFSFYLKTHDALMAGSNALSVITLEYYNAAQALIASTEMSGCMIKKIGLDSGFSGGGGAQPSANTNFAKIAVEAVFGGAISVVNKMV